MGKIFQISAPVTAPKTLTNIASFGGGKGRDRLRRFFFQLMQLFLDKATNLVFVAKIFAFTVVPIHGWKDMIFAMETKFFCDFYYREVIFVRAKKS